MLDADLVRVRGCLAARIDVVLDCGFTAPTHRDECRALALRAGAGVHLHIVTADAALRAERVRARNREQRETFALLVTEDMFIGSESQKSTSRGQVYQSSSRIPPA